MIHGYWKYFKIRFLTFQVKQLVHFKHFFESGIICTYLNLLQSCKKDFISMRCRFFPVKFLRWKILRLNDYLQIKFILRLFRIISFDFKNLNLIEGTWKTSWVLPWAGLEGRGENIVRKIQSYQTQWSVQNECKFLQWMKRGRKFRILESRAWHDDDRWATSFYWSTACKVWAT